MQFTITEYLLIVLIWIGLLNLCYFILQRKTQHQQLEPKMPKMEATPKPEPEFKLKFEPKLEKRKPSGKRLGFFKRNRKEDAVKSRSDDQFYRDLFGEVSEENGEGGERYE